MSCGYYNIITVGYYSERQTDQIWAMQRIVVSTKTKQAVYYTVVGIIYRDSSYYIPGILSTHIYQVYSMGPPEQETPDLGKPDEILIGALL